MPYTITSDCIACGTCLPECPVNAIREAEIYEIDPETCIACRKCADICPVHACQPME
ncbi:4Fe-4S binding protein [bacterium]|nr:4Fe-4S binding protein [candidate division CSSED10-310 bacterium]